MLYHHRVHILIGLIALTLIILGGLALWIASLRIPDLNTFDERVVLQSTKIYDRTGDVLLFDVHDDIQRTLVEEDAISRHIKNAAVAIEDATFYEHEGIRPKAILRAVLVNLGLREGRTQGGSTITQQVIKNALLTSERTISRKLKEWALALKIEQVLSKEEILTLYLNEAPFGGNIYGVEEAAQAFFGASAFDVTLAQAAYLAALPQAPTFYSPYGNNRSELDARKDLVLEKMLEYKFITDEEYTTAQEATVDFDPRPESRLKAPHFVMQIREYLETTYGKRAVEEDGLRVITTLDYTLQEKAEAIVNEYALSNAENFNAENAGLVAVDPKTGQLLVMVGSRDYFDDEIDGNFNITLAHRQPGSAFKPFVYATAFKKGYTPNTILFDVSTEFSTTCSADSRQLEQDAVCYRPGNYDDTFRGPMTIRDALAQSVNVPAVKALYLAGLPESLETARDLGIEGLSNPDQYGLTLVLGGGEVTPLEMARAYGVFAHGGVYNPTATILSIEDKHGNTLESFTSRSSQVIDESVAYHITDILSDNEARTPAFGSNSHLHFGDVDVAAKTGTTNDYRDAWIVGYTPTIAAAAWAGNNDNSPMEKKVAGFIIAPLWNEFMQEALTHLPQESFTRPLGLSSSEELKPVFRGIWEGGESFVIDTISGKLATSFTPEGTRKEYVVPNIHSILYWVNKDDPYGPSPRNDSRDPQFPRWEAPVLSWANTYQSGTIPVRPDEFDDVHTEENLPELEILGIENNDTLSRSDTLSFSVRSSGRYTLTDVSVFINGRYIGESTEKPFSFTLPLENLEGLTGSNTLRVVGTDRVFNTGDTTLSFILTNE